jgi:hypothetical protein
MFHSTRRCYCAYCRTERLVYRKRHISFVDAILALVASLTLSFSVWQTIDPRAVIFFAFGLGFAEVFVLIRWRMTIVCPKCGFDPVLYKKNPKMASDRVGRFTDWRKQDPLWLPSPRPTRSAEVNSMGKKQSRNQRNHHLNS